MPRSGNICWTSVALALAFAAPAGAQQPYAGQETREIKALSKAEVDDLLNGRGMGLAKAAELNDFPGPMHVIELSSQLGLDAGQRARVEASFARMKEAAAKLGGELVELERRLDRRFAQAHIDAAELERLTAEIGRVSGALRRVHLEAHLEVRALLDPAQIERYAHLRGYRGAGAAPQVHNPAHKR